MKTKIFTLFLVFFGYIGSIFAESGKCGQNLTWNLTDSVLTISGTGDMTDYDMDAPWSTSMKTIIIEDGVTSIGTWAFGECNDLTSVTIPNSVTRIGSSAFELCGGLTSVTIPNSVISIGSRAFFNVPNIVYSGVATGYPWGARSVNGYVDGYLVYRDDTKTTLIACSTSAQGGIVIPNSVTRIYGDAFRDCWGLTSVHISNITAWCAINFGGAYANPLCYAHNLYLSDVLVTDLDIPDSVTSIGSRAFEECSSLTSVTIPNSVTSIGYSAFYRCTGLTSVTIPNSVTSIWLNAFSGCIGLVSVTIGKSVTRIESQAFYGCSGLTTIEWNAINCADFSSSSNAPFYNIRSQITSFILGDSVEHIPAYLCNGMNNLNIVTIPNIVTSIGSSAFEFCSGLTSITIPNSVTSIGNLAFGYCSGLTSITIPNSVTSIGGSTFRDCTGLTSVTIGNSITNIGGGAFYGCSGLTLITIENVTPPTLATSTVFPAHVLFYIPCGTAEIYKSAENWSAYADMIMYKPLPHSLQATVKDSIGGYVIVPQNMCDGLSLEAVSDYGYHFTQWSDGNTDNPRTIVLNQDTTFTAEFAVDKNGTCGENNALLWSYSDDKTLTISGSGALTENYTYGLEAPIEAQQIVIGDEVTEIGDSAFFEMASIQSVTFGESVTSIGNYAFTGLNDRKFNKLELPSGIVTIGNSAFEGCAYLESIDFGEELESIGEKAFYGCTRVLSMICLAQITPNVGTSGLTSISSQAELYVLKDCIQKYIVDNNWSRFLIKEYVDPSEGFENLSAEGSAPQKVMIDGQIFILRGEKVYTLQGQEVK